MKMVTSNLNTDDSMTIDRFWFQLEWLVSQCEIVIDRPAGTTHPRYPNFIYPYDYGYLKDTNSMDLGGIDIWIGSLSERKVSAIICTVDVIKKDTEIKILLGCTDDEAGTILASHNSDSMSGLLILRNKATE